MQPVAPNPHISMLTLHKIMEVVSMTHERHKFMYLKGEPGTLVDAMTRLVFIKQYHYLVSELARLAQDQRIIKLTDFIGSELIKKCCPSLLDEAYANPFVDIHACGSEALIRMASPDLTQAETDVHDVISATEACRWLEKDKRLTERLQFAMIYQAETTKICKEPSKNKQISLINNLITSGCFIRNWGSHLKDSNLTNQFVWLHINYPEDFVSLANRHIKVEQYNSRLNTLQVVVGQGALFLATLMADLYLTQGKHTPMLHLMTSSKSKHNTENILRYVKGAVSGVSQYISEREYKETNKRLCKEIKANIKQLNAALENSPDCEHWVTQLLELLKIELKDAYTYTDRTREWTFQQKNEILCSVQAISETKNTTPGLHACTKLLFFPTLVTTVFCEIRPRCPLNPTEVIAIFQKKKDRIARVWNFVAYLNRRNERDVLETLFQKCPPFLEFLLKAIPEDVSPQKDLNNTAMLETLARMKHLMDIHPPFRADFLSGRLDSYIENLPISLNLSNMEAVFTSLVSLQTERPLSLQIVIETDAVKVNAELEAFLLSKGVSEDEDAAKAMIGKFFMEYKENKRYSDRYRIYGAKAWIAGLEACMLSGAFELKTKADAHNSSSHSATQRVDGGRSPQEKWMHAFEVLMTPDGLIFKSDGPPAREALTEACFKSYLEVVAQLAGYRDPWTLAQAFHQQFHFLIETLNDHHMTVERNEALLKNIKSLVLYSIQLLQEGASFRNLFYWLDRFCQLYPQSRETFESGPHVEAAQRFLNVNTNPDILRILERSQEAVRKMENGEKLSPDHLKKQPNVAKIRANLEKEPFLLLTEVAPYLVQAFLPELPPESLQKFKDALALCKKPFERSPLAKELLNVIHPLISDPFILTALESPSTFVYVKEYFDNLIVQLNTLFRPIAKGEAVLGHSLTEKEIAELIEMILEIRKIKKDPTKQLSDIQKGLLDKAPSLADTIETVAKALGKSSSVLNFKVGSLNVGQNIGIALAQTATGFASQAASLINSAADAASSVANAFNSAAHAFSSLLSTTKAIEEKKPEVKEDGISTNALAIQPVREPATTAIEKEKTEEPSIVTTIFKLIQCVEDDKMITKTERELILAALKTDVIPIVAKVIPVLQKNHDFNAYVTIFKEINEIIQSQETADAALQKDRKRLGQLIASLITLVPREIEQYMEELTAVYDALIYLEHHPIIPWWEPFGFSMENSRRRAPQPLLLSTVATTLSTTTTTMTTTTPIQPVNNPLQAVVVGAQAQNVADETVEHSICQMM